MKGGSRCIVRADFQAPCSLREAVVQVHDLPPLLLCTIMVDHGAQCIHTLPDAYVLLDITF